MKKQNEYDFAKRIDRVIALRGASTILCKKICMLAAEKLQTEVEFVDSIACGYLQEYQTLIVPGEIGLEIMDWEYCIDEEKYWIYEGKIRDLEEQIAVNMDLLSEYRKSLQSLQENLSGICEDVANFNVLTHQVEKLSDNIRSAYKNYAHEYN